MNTDDTAALAAVGCSLEVFFNFTPGRKEKRLTFSCQQVNRKLPSSRRHPHKGSPEMSPANVDIKSGQLLAFLILSTSAVETSRGPALQFSPMLVM